MLQWVTLEEAKTGMIHLRMSWLQLTSDIDDLKLVSEHLSISLSHVSTHLSTRDIMDTRYQARFYAEVPNICLQLRLIFMIYSGDVLT